MGRTYTQRFTRAGKYRLFCSLHPVVMHEIVDVREPASGGSQARSRAGPNRVSAAPPAALSRFTGKRPTAFPTFRAMNAIAAPENESRLAAPDRRDWLRVAGGMMFGAGALVLLIRKGEDWSDWAIFFALLIPALILFAVTFAGRARGELFTGWQVGFLVFGTLLLLGSFLQLVNAADGNPRTSLNILWTFGWPPPWPSSPPWRCGLPSRCCSARCSRSSRGSRCGTRCSRTRRATRCAGS